MSLIDCSSFLDRDCAGSCAAINGLAEVLCNTRIAAAEKFIPPFISPFCGGINGGIKFGINYHCVYKFRYFTFEKIFILFSNNQFCLNRLFQ